MRRAPNQPRVCATDEAGASARPFERIQKHFAKLKSIPVRDEAGRELGPYLLVSRLAAGGMGEVYVGVRRGIGQFQKPLAVKLLLPHLTLNPKAVQRFLDEARLSARMSHPNVAQVFDVGFVDDRYFLAMELVRGASLSSLISALGSAPQGASAELIAYIGRALSDGLHHAHELTDSSGQVLEVVHRDVTPHNVLVSVDGGVKLTDFGVARMLDGSSETSPGAVIGKLAYMAPEQLRGEAVDRRSDVFGVGATLFHLATLRRPFGAGGGAMLDLNALRPDLPRSLRETILRCLAASPVERFLSARALRDALPHAPGGEELLGALVKELCARTVQRLDEQTIYPTETGTELLSSASAVGTSDVRRGRSRGWLGLAAAAVVAIVAGVGLLSSREPPKVAQAPPLPSIEAEPPTLQERRAPEPERREPPRRPAPPPAAARARTKPVAVGTGFLSIDARPWASVFVDGTKVGDTPLAALPVEAGRHRVKLVNPETGKEHEEQVTVKAGEKSFLKADLRVQ